MQISVSVSVKNVDAKLAKETSYGELAEIEALCNYEGKDFNLK